LEPSGRFPLIIAVVSEGDEQVKDIADRVTVQKGVT
jgi:hypothetical protein